MYAYASASPVNPSSVSVLSESHDPDPHDRTERTVSSFLQKVCRQFLDMQNHRPPEHRDETTRVLVRRTDLEGP